MQSHNTEQARLVLIGRDADDNSRAELIVMGYAGGVWALHCAAPSRTVVLPASEAARLVGTMAPDGPEEIVLATRARGGVWHYATTRLPYGAELPSDLAASLARALHEHLQRQTQGGFPPQVTE